MAARFSGGDSPTSKSIAKHYPDTYPFLGFAERTPSGPRWTGRVELIESMLDIPLRRRKPTTYFVNSMSDLFHDGLPIEAIAEVFFRMAEAQQHTFQVLTKRADRLPCALRLLRPLVAAAWERFDGGKFPWPLPNVWLGVSCENQETADERIPLLLQTPAAVRFVSLEPLLGPVDLGHILWRDCEYNALTRGRDNDGGRLPHLDWVILGGESGPGARPMHPQWARNVRDACLAAGVPFFFKQWGEWAPGYPMIDRLSPNYGKVQQVSVQLAPESRNPCAKYERMTRVGKTAAGHLLDGQEWRQMPEVKR
jgi:protein gp37